jgi:hypothetical protein
LENAKSNVRIHGKKLEGELVGFDENDGGARSEKSEHR